jgi:hypothetical protein
MDTSPLTILAPKGQATLPSSMTARREMAEGFEALRTIASDVRMPSGEEEVEADMVMVDH